MRNMRAFNPVLFIVAAVFIGMVWLSNNFAETLPDQDPPPGFVSTPSSSEQVIDFLFAPAILLPSLLHLQHSSIAAFISTSSIILVYALLIERIITAIKSRVRPAVSANRNNK